jgi:hypothetical protein
MAHIGANELGLRTGIAQLSDEAGSGIIMAAGDNKLRSLLGIGDSGGAGDACQGAGNQNDGRIHISSFPVA